MWISVRLYGNKSFKAPVVEVVKQKINDHVLFDGLTRLKSNKIHTFWYNLGSVCRICISSYTSDQLASSFSVFWTIKQCCNWWENKLEWIKQNRYLVD